MTHATCGNARTSKPATEDDPLEGEPMGRRQLARRRALAGTQDARDLAGVDPAVPHCHEGPDQCPDHLVAEGVRPEPELEAVGLAVDGQPLEAPDRRASPARLPAEGREVVLAD